MKCKYCRENYKGVRGVHIHQYYCLTKRFTEMDKVVADGDLYHSLLENPFFISNLHYLPSFFSFMVKGEVGMLYDKRYYLLD